MKSKILIIDDDKDLLRSFQIILENNDFEVLTAINGHIGYDLLLKEDPNLVVLDVMMRTNLEGYNLLHQIKKEPKFKSLPIIMLTGMIDQLGVNLAPGVEDDNLFPNVWFFDKPIDPAVLSDKICDILNP